MIIFLLILILALWYFRPWFDSYTDENGEKHIVLWYNWITGRKFVHWAAQ